MILLDFILLLSLYFLSFIDIYSTKIGIMKYGFREGNPIFKREIEEEGINWSLIGLKFLAPSFFLVDIIIGLRISFVLIFSNIVLFLVVSNNIRLIKRRKRIFDEFWDKMIR